MLDFDASDFAMDITSLQYFAAQLGHSKTAPIAPQFARRLGVTARSLSKRCASLGLPLCVNMLDRLNLILKDKSLRTRTILEQQTTQAVDLVVSDLQQPRFFYIPSDKVSYYKHSLVKKGDIKDNFASTIDDFESAGDCLAFGKTVACVFHSMRVAEIALKAIGASLGIPDPIGPDRNWGKMLEKINPKVDAESDQSKKAFFRESVALLDSMRVAWRNACMHIEKDYNEEKAKGIYESVKNLILHLRAHLKDDGSYA